MCIEFSHEIFNSDWDSVCVHLETEITYNITSVCLFVGSYSQGVEYWIKSDP